MKGRKYRKEKGGREGGRKQLIDITIGPEGRLRSMDFISFNNWY